MKRIKDFLKKNLFLFLFIVLLLIPLVDLLQPGLPITHDGKDHVARIANFYQNLQEGTIIPRWAGNLNWGYGHPILMFLYPLPSYMGSLFHFLGFSFVDSTKLIFGVSFILSGLTMYLWLRAFLPSSAAFAGGILYTFAPYRFVDLYVRGAIGEHVAFIFPPLVLYFMYQVFKKPSSWNLLGGTVSLAGLILAHNAISLMFLPLIGFYALFLLWQSKKKKSLTFHFSLLILFGFLLSAFFWVPAFFEGKYTLRETIFTGGIGSDRFVQLPALFYGPWDYGINGRFTVQIGLLHWLVVLLSIPFIVYWFKKKNPLWILAGCFFFIFILTAFLMTVSAKPIWDIITLLQKFQFSWRLLSLSVFLTAVLGALIFSVFSLRKQQLFLIILIVLALFLNKDYWHANGYLQRPEIFYTGIYEGTTDTGESAPIWSVRFMEQTPPQPIEIIGGTGTIAVTDRTTTKHTYDVKADSTIQVRENTLYFPGWGIFVDGKPTTIEYQDPNNRGLMTFFVPQGEHTVTVSFTETNLRTIANLISLLSIVILISFIFVRKKLWRS